MLNLEHRLSLFWLPLESEKDPTIKKEKTEEEIEERQESENAKNQATQ